LNVALSRERKAELAAMDLPDDRQTRWQLQHFMNCTGYTLRDVADAVGYSLVALHLFLSGRYDAHHERESNTLNIRAKLKEFMEENELPSSAQNVGRFYESSEFKIVRRAFYDAVNNGRACCIDAAPGGRKTWMLRALRDELTRIDANKNGSARRAVYVYCRAGIRPLALLRRICAAANIPPRGMIDQLTKKIQFHFAKHRAVLVFDEAQHLDDLALETLRELLDEPPYIGIVFAGSHDVQARFRDLVMEQWRERIRKPIELSGLTRDEAIGIVAEELPKLKHKAQEAIADGAVVVDLRRGRDVKYISARVLFFSIDEVKQQMQRQEA
jgi:type II secretory pathway predicted ATPase ExeA